MKKNVRFSVIVRNGKVKFIIKNKALTAKK